MMNKKLHDQIIFFDDKNHQYDKSLIQNPPLHTRLEINLILKELRTINRNNYIVDFGAGSGRLTIPLLQNSFSVLAVDISKKSLQSLTYLARTLSLDALKTSPTIQYIEKTQGIVGTDILHHVDIDYYLPMFYSILKKNGRIVFSEPGALNLIWYFYLPLFSNWGVEKGILTCTFSNLKNKLEKYGFKRIKIIGLGLFPRPLLNFSKKLCLLNDKLGNIPVLKYFAYRYIIIAYK